MIELKAISGHEIREDIDYNTRGIDPEDKEWNNYGKELCDTLYYLKPEADKVIAEKDAEIAQLQEMLEERNKQVGELKAQKAQAEDDCAYWKTKAQRERHSDYKRCLDKAAMCEARYDEEDARVNGHYSSWEYISEEMKYWERWQKRWLELAEKFKEAK